jgi:hypothetical protein
MSIGKRILDVARSNLNDLLDKVREIEGDGPEERPARPSASSDPFLDAAQRELDEALRGVRSPSPSPNAPPPRREANYDDAARWVAEQQAKRGTTGSKGATPTGGARPASGPRPGSAGATGRRAPSQIAQHYAMLQLQPGASLEQVKDAYRRLMRKHHPDRFANDPVGLRRATEISQKLSRAYMELQNHLNRPR